MKNPVEYTVFEGPALQPSLDHWPKPGRGVRTAVVAAAIDAWLENGHPRKGWSVSELHNPCPHPVGVVFHTRAGPPPEHWPWLQMFHQIPPRGIYLPFRGDLSAATSFEFRPLTHIAVLWNERDRYGRLMNINGGRTFHACLSGPKPDMKKVRKYMRRIVRDPGVASEAFRRAGYFPAYLDPYIGYATGDLIYRAGGWRAASGDKSRTPALVVTAPR